MPLDRISRDQHGGLAQFHYLPDRAGHCGGVRIRVTPEASVEVCDSGPGIPPQLREKVFQRFWRGESSAEGAGLGLSIVRRIMHALKGNVSVTDAPEGGAQFTLQFPTIA